MTTATATTPDSFWSSPLAVPLRPRTFGSVLYLWLGFPLGLIYFVVLTVGFTLGLPLTLLWVGFLLLLATFTIAWLAQGLERQLAIHLLGAAVPRRVATSPRPGVLGGLRAVAASPALWKGLLFLFLKFPLGLAGWMVSLVALVLPLALLASPLAILFGRGYVDLGFWQPDTVVETLPVALAGLLGLVASLYLHHALGWVWARLAEWLLGATSPHPTTQLPPAIDVAS